jgi:hypothetical protein
MCWVRLDRRPLRPLPRWPSQRPRHPLSRDPFGRWSPLPLVARGSSHPCHRLAARHAPPPAGSLLWSSMRCAELESLSVAALLWSLAPSVYSCYTRVRSWYGVLSIRLVVCCCAVSLSLRHLVATAILALWLPAGQKLAGPLQTYIHVTRSGAALSHAPKNWTGADPARVLTSNILHVYTDAIGYLCCT